jgi:hypothetical protein
MFLKKPLDRVSVEFLLKNCPHDAILVFGPFLFFSPKIKFKILEPLSTTKSGRIGNFIEELSGLLLFYAMFLSVEFPGTGFQEKLH